VRPTARARARSPRILFRAAPGRRSLLFGVGLLGACSSSAAPLAPAPPIVFDWSLNGTRSIYRAGLDASDTVRLSAGAADDEHPSERSGLVVFTSYRTGRAELYSVPAGGGAPTQLTTASANETDPALSPDGTKIAYVSDVSGVTKLWLCAADGSGQEPLTSGFGFAGSIEASPSWAPDGQRIVFVSTANGSANLFVLTLGGGLPTPLVTGPSANVEPAWNPDGTIVAFASNRSTGGSTNIFTVDVTTQVVAQVTSDTGRPPGLYHLGEWRRGATVARSHEPGAHGVGAVERRRGARGRDLLNRPARGWARAATPLQCGA